MNCKNCNDLISHKQFILAFIEKYKTILPNYLSTNDYCKTCLLSLEEDLKQELITNQIYNKPQAIVNIHNNNYFGDNKKFNTNYIGFPDNNLSDGVYVLRPDSIECQSICNRFTYPNKILFIEKNINSVLLKNFRNEIGNNKVVNLFHGSSNDNYDSILSNGLLVEKSACGLLGNGIYGAENSLYSTSYAKKIFVKMTPEIKNAIINKKYATDNNTSIKAMLLCDFILTDKSKNYDCGGLGIIHAVYNNNCVYPGYLIYFND